MSQAAKQKHYFIADPELEVVENGLHLSLFGYDFRFITRNGLFSYDKPDAASVLLLEVIQAATPPFTGKLLDLGCGYGLLGIVLAKAHSQGLTLTMSDTNPIACQYAQKNADANGVAAAVVHSDGFENLNDMYDAIVLNPPIHAGKGTTYRLYTEAAAHLRTNGALYIVIQKKHGAETALSFLKELYEVEILYKRKGYFIARCVKV